MCVGNLPTSFFNRIKHLPFTFTVMNLNKRKDHYVDDVVPYHSNIIVISCQDFKDYEALIVKLVASPYWHPLANIILYYNRLENKELIAKIFFSLWYHKAINTVMVQYNDVEDTFLVSNYTPYVNEKYEIQPSNKFGCWTTRNLGIPVVSFVKGLTCVERCHNVTILSRLRAQNLGTCIGYDTIAIKSTKDLKQLNLFEDRSKDFHGFMFRSYVTEVEPFSLIDVHEDGSYTLRARDGMIWNTMSKLMNFGIDLSPSVSAMKKPFNFEVNIEQIFSFARRKGDLCLFPIYQFDVIVVEIDFTFPFKESGICIAAGRAGFETTLFKMKNLTVNLKYLVVFYGCFACIWMVFSLYKAAEKGHFTCDQIGKDFMNAWRNVLMLNLCNPPKYESFRIFLTLCLWSFFVLNFTTQAKIISFFTAAKRGKEVDTFEDVIEKGYPIEAMASPDLILPDTEEKFRIINSRLVYEQDIYGCITRMASDNRRFCLIDCSVGRYIKRNKLNNKGEQYLHIAERDRIHSHYLTMVLSKHSPLTDRYNRYMMMIFEAGLIGKWEQYRYTDIKDEVTTKALSIQDLSGIFKVFCFYIGLTLISFMFELAIPAVESCRKKMSKSRKRKFLTKVRYD